VHADIGDLSLEPDVNTAFFRIFQETLTNIIRHAGATHVTVNLKEDGGRVIMEVRDNGRGISKAEISNTTSMGLLNMRERAALVGGDFKISRLPRGKGTTVTVSVPVQAARYLDSEHENSVDRRSRSRSPRLEANSR
jgi:signal transduction histidine kinase